MSKRKITDTLNLKFEPFDRYGSVIPGMSWHKISFDKENGYGTYISKLEPGTKTIPHTHLGFEEFLGVSTRIVVRNHYCVFCSPRGLGVGFV